MTEQERKRIACELSALSVFRGIHRHKPIAALLEYLGCDGTAQQKMKMFGEFVFSLAEDDYSFSNFLCRAVYEDENQYIIGTAQGRALPTVLTENAKAELSLFSRLTELSAAELCEGVDYGGYLPRFENTPTNFVEAYATRLREIGRYGYGIFASAGMFRVEDGEILPVEAADDITLDSFVGYEEERQKVLNNTRVLAEGGVAANVLLFGDAGTGKSSTVKACANHFTARGFV